MSATVNVRYLCEGATIRPIHLTVLGLCFLTNVIDGLDTQVIGITATPMARDLGVSLPMFSLVFSAGTAGVLLGATTLGRLADRYGRRRSLMAFTVLFGLFTLVTPLVRTTTELAALRFISGLGLGGAMPVFLTLVAEYAPKSRKALATGLLWCGYPIGGMIGGLLGSTLIDTRGWEMMYVIGGLAALITALLQAVFLPESPFYLAQRPAEKARLAKLAAAIAPELQSRQVTILPDVAPSGQTEAQSRSPITDLFANGRTAPTLLLWLPLFCTFTITKFTVLWAPSIFESSGMSVGRAALMQAIGNIASVPSMVIAGYLLDRVGAGRVLPAAYGLLALTFVVLANSLSDANAVALSMMAIGLLQGPGIAGLLFLATNIYPSNVRSTGVGVAMGVGRTGQLFVALFVGALIAAGLGPSGVVMTMAAAPAIALVAILLLVPRIPAAENSGIAVAEAKTGIVGAQADTSQHDRDAARPRSATKL